MLINPFHSVSYTGWCQTARCICGWIPVPRPRIVDGLGYNVCSSRKRIRFQLLAIFYHRLPRNHSSLGKKMRLSLTSLSGRTAGQKKHSTSNRPISKVEIWIMYGRHVEVCKHPLMSEVRCCPGRTPLVLRFSFSFLFAVFSCPYHLVMLVTPTHLRTHSIVVDPCSTVDNTPHATKTPQQKRLPSRVSRWVNSFLVYAPPLRK